jgi:phage gpG-like protein
MNLLEAGALFFEMAHTYENHVHEALEHAAVIVEDESKRVIGTYDYGWAPLKPATVARKSNGDTPLLETGEMRESIEHVVQGKSAHVGSNNDKAVWQELGTSRGIPPRSFLGEAARRKGPEVAQAIGAAIAMGLGTSGALGYSNFAGAARSTAAAVYKP